MITASVIITTKNRREELLKAVESAMAQRGLLEVVVIDDGSTDGTAEAVLEMLKSGNAEKLKPGHPAADSGERCATEIEDRRSKKGEKQGAGSVEQGGEGRVAAEDGLEPRIARMGTDGEPHPGGWAAARETAARQPAGRDERERTSQHARSDTKGAAQGDAQGTCAGASEPDLLTSELADASVSESLTRSASAPALAAEQPKADGGQLKTYEKSEELVHKSSGGEGSGSMSPIGQSSCAGAKPELPVCEQGRDGEHDLTTKSTTPVRQRIAQGEVECVGWEPTGAKRSEKHEMEDAGQRLAGQAGAVFSNPFTSELARDSENSSLTRSADNPASSLATAPEAQTLDARRARLWNAEHIPLGWTLDPQAAAKPQLRLIRHEVSAGYIVRRNEGARLAKGDVIFSLDDDAVFSSPFVVEQTLGDFSHPRIGAVAIPYIEPHKANREMQRAPTREDVWITASYIGTAHAVRRDVFLALGGYREHLVHQGEEGDFCLRMLAAEQKEKAESGNAEKLKTDLTTEDTESTEGDAGPCLDRPSGAAFSNPSLSELARDSENTSLIRSASGPAGARIALGEVGSGGGNQLADSGEFLEGQSQAGLQMDSQKHPTPRVATGSDTSGENFSSVSISVIGGEKNSGAPEALSLDSGRSALDAAPLSAVPGFFVRLGNSDVIIHNESPKRDYSRMDFYGRRNDVLFHWQNTPMPDLLWQLPMTIAGGLVCAAKVGRWRKMLEGIGAGFLAIAGGVKREPVSRLVSFNFKHFKKAPIRIPITFP